MDLLAPDVVQISDGGGKVVAARRPITGRGDVARFVLGVLRTTTEATQVEHATYNGMLAARFVTDGELDWLVAFEIHDSRITGLYGVRRVCSLFFGRVGRARRTGSLGWPMKGSRQRTSYEECGPGSRRPTGRADDQPLAAALLAVAHPLGDHFRPAPRRPLEEVLHHDT